MIAHTPTDGALRSELESLLTEARERTFLLVDRLSDEDLLQQHDPLMSPILWDLGHIAHFEELWLTQNLDGPIRFSEMPGLYNPFENPRSVRGTLPLPRMDHVRRKFAEIRERVLEKLQTIDFSGDNPLLRDGYVYRMVLQHEYQHNETILQTLQLKQGAPYPAPRARSFGQPAFSHAPATSMVRFPGGVVPIGTDDRSAAYDNERPVHTREVAPFRIDRTPVTNGAFLEFMNDRGYRNSRHWSPEGWEWITQHGIDSPKHWSLHGESWTVRSMDAVTEVDPAIPVSHVCWFEADAFARWAGKRLPSEIEWESAASYDPVCGESRAFPWGDAPPSTERANLDQLAFGAAPTGTFATSSPIGCEQMIGDVWEWTSSDFSPYPGFEAFPYPEYSEPSFGTDYKVLRGGSWATRPGAVRNTFRNWDYAIRRQIFSGFRCAADD